ncbi:MAG: excinuclease ABC subunit UvrC [Candidatus Latescibacterota bacterium]|nr:excinuclease ABC subunit UvrC [Candidatus Latescibacterota bacterium]
MDSLSQDHISSYFKVDRRGAQSSLREALDHLPRASGVYLMRDGAAKIIYIGKAKSLRNRVRSYFTPKAFDGRSQFLALVSNVREVEYIVTDSDREALILEANLVKEHKPRYNITLKDDKKYPYIKVTAETYPRVIVTRDVEKDGSRYLGPYTNVKAMRNMLNLMHKLFRVRSCDYALPNKKVRLCIDFEIGRCDGPCEDLITPENYKKLIKEAVLFLTGRRTKVARIVREEMELASEELRFEEAAICRDRLDALERVTNRQKMMSQDLSDWDLIAIAREDDEACGVVMEIREGRLIGRQHYFIGGVLDAPESEVRSSFIRLFYLTASFVPREVYVAGVVDDKETILEWLHDRVEAVVEIKVPQRGDKAQLLKMAEGNANLLLTERRLKRENRKQQVPASVSSLQRDLSLDKPPRRVEAMDISNIQGSDPVASLVCFVDGRPSKKDYRHFKITGIEGPNDFAMMHQVVTRRFRRLSEEGQTFPDLLMVDGGKGQLSTAVSALRSLGIKDQPVIGLAKKLEEVFVPGHSDPQNIPKVSSSLKLLQALRDESHRFAVTFHRQVRKKRTLHSVLEDIEGVGPARRKQLLRHFGSMKRLREAELEDVKAVEGVGPKLAEQIVMALGAKDSE